MSLEALKPELEKAQAYARFSSEDEREEYQLLVKFEALAEKVLVTETDPFKAAVEVKNKLKQLGFRYDEHAFKMGEVLSGRKGNCLGLTLLVGAILEYNGIDSGFSVVLNPHDSVDDADEKMYERLLSDKKEERLLDPADPQVFSLKLWQDELEVSPERCFRFVSLEHPVLNFGKKHLELTNLDDRAADQDWFPKYDRKADLSYQQLASCVPIEALRREVNLSEKSDSTTYRRVVAEFQKAIRVWPGNREAYATLAIFAAKNGDLKLASDCADEYVKIGGNDVRFYTVLYTLTSDPQYLDKAYWQKQYDLSVFYHKKVVNQPDKAKKQRYLAMASWMAAFSSFISLEQFYENEARADIIDVYGEDYYTDLMERAF